MNTESPMSCFYGKHVTHTKLRDDAIVHGGRWMVPTVYGEESGNTQWVETLTELREAGGTATFNADQTEVWLTLPVGYKFSIKMLEQERAAADGRELLKEVVECGFLFGDAGKYPKEADLANRIRAYLEKAGAR